MNKKFKWDAQYVLWGITAFFVIAVSIALFLVLSEWPSVRELIIQILNVLSPVIYGLMFAYLFNKLMTFLENRLISHLVSRKLKDLEPRKRRRLVRVLSVVLTMIIALLIIGGAITLIVPQLIGSLRSLVAALPVYFNTVVVWLTGVLEENSTLESAAVNLLKNSVDRLSEWIQSTLLSQADQIISNLVGGVIGVIRVVANLLIGLVISIYVMYHKERFTAQTKKITYGIFKIKTANNIITAARFLDKTCGSFITSKLIDSLIVGVVCYIVLAILKMPYPMLVAAIVGITNIIPFFGPFIGGIPSALLILLVNPTQCLIFTIFIIILQQLDGNVLYPKIQGSSIGISGFWIIFALLFFGGLFGFWGMLLGVPVFAVIYAFVKSINEAKLKSRGLPVNTGAYVNISAVDTETNELIYNSVADVQERYEDAAGGINADGDG